ncbi:MAG: HAD family hydrolase [Bacteroidales bacterium]|nr:HAD family hydrolase [Bacteroidales bacterium]
MNKAVFFDRDGVINYERGEYTYKLKDFIFNNEVIKNIHRLYSNGFIIIIISNQGGIAKGIYTKNDVEKLNKYINEAFKKNNIELKEIYYCPHHSDIENCLCRKPDSLLLEKAITKYNIEPSASYFIGDSERDIISAKKAGINPIKIIPNENITKYCNLILKKL